MKVLVIWRLLTVGGVNAGWRNRAIYFKQQGIFTEFLYTTDRGGLHIMDGVAPVYLTKDENKIVSIIRNGRYDAIIVVDTADAYRWLGKAEFDGPVIIEARTPEINKLSPHIKDFRPIQPATIVVPSLYQKRLASILTENIPIQVIYNGVDTSFFRPIAGADIHHNTPPTVTAGKKVIGWIGRIDRRKNWKLLLRIADLIQKERNDIEFWVIGGAQSVQRDKFAARRIEQKLDDIVKWFPVIPYQEMPHIYAKIRETGGCTLATTRGESFGNTFIEAMACGVPVVAPGVTSLPELVIHRKTGLLFREGHTREAIKHIYRIVDMDQARYEKMSRAAVRQVQEKFAMECIAPRYTELLRTLVGKVKYP
ncbi:glycosyltransferase family 4 protein [Aneurinibacillus migulanus]|uniref:Glycosyl transferases group 1 n=1 Tax=Aneurinibacillus migulanus TaxID=47500 RepID=A0A0D1XTH1_ANEMI|nr:glycosyltransferase family 4 protein [Aneurinibacillus migulanus]KIV55458.1 group 1 glycosyl transferase [Aneurinibacillus migulanus]KON90757.1 group 1 glycosyl transferase [Aneurinibacillus migulanus]MED0895359.1 glycosyltransferase family 4 protein [Aneurinibacillus migulanus]MED1618015.1 glycosyltransferase family 4 protein [Aneurinibacillus migulanus]SDK00446.1 Glycosyl transferases group 1 [Aneurinibacillus migulanus]